MKVISIKRLVKLMLLNSIIFIGLGIGSIFFEFLFLGWGASANSPAFNMDFAIICQIIVLALLSIKKYEDSINYEMIIASLFILFAYLLLKFIPGII